ESTEAKIFAEYGCPEFYALTKDTKFVAGKTYYTKSCETYSAASSVTPGSAVTADTYYVKHYTAIFSPLVIGAHDYAVTDVTGGGLEHIIKQLGYGDDPLNQRSS
ncbi:N4-gp56 family major capsid protein, partial [[Eubacterium] siraeum]|nr:N4-gp56 family major capsid protein [[Eubacterium] siraeum]